MKNKSPSHYKKTEPLLKNQYTNKVDPKDKFLVDRKNYEVFRDLYFCEDGEGFEELTAKERNRFRIKLDYNSSRQLPSKFLLIGGHHFSHSPVIGSLPTDSFQMSLTQFERSKSIIKKRINLIFLSNKESGLMNLW